MPPTNGTKRESGVVATHRMQAAGKRACDAYKRNRALADEINAELDDITGTGGVPHVELHEEDSLVVVVKDALVANASASK
jgi:hypothetical protein